MHQPAPIPGFLQRHRVKIGAAVLALAALVIFLATRHGSSPEAKREVIRPTMIVIPPTPPPPPVKVPPPPKEMEKQVPVENSESKPETPDNQPKSPAPAGPATLGNGPSSWKLGSGSGDGDGGGSRWGWYASSVQNTVAQALRENRTTHHASIGLTARIWPDLTGRVTRAELVGTTGNPALDAAIRDEVLVGLVLPEPPPAGMKMPINMRIAATP